MITYGVNAVLEGLRAGRVRAIRLASMSPNTAEIRRLAARAGVPVTQVPVSALDRAAGGGTHQGVVADATAPTLLSLEELLADVTHPALFLVLDGIEDPQNLGAILRAADAAGVAGVIRQTRRAAPLATVAKTSAGALAHVRLASVVNIARSVTWLQSAGVFVVGLEADGESLYGGVDFTVSTAVVLGSEGRGLRRLVRERCDRVVSIPMLGQVNSLNVGVAAGVVLYEAVRQRQVDQSRRAPAPDSQARRRTPDAAAHQRHAGRG